MAGPSDPYDRASGLHVPPPLIFAAAVLAGWLLDRAIPGPRPDWLVSGPGAIAGASLVTAGGALAFAGVLNFWRAKTTILPFKTATRFVATGPYRFTRNPMYVGLSTISIGVALLLRDLWTIPLVFVAAAVIDRFVIRGEERHLEARFGDDFRDYKRRVRRWL